MGWEGEFQQCCLWGQLGWVAVRGRCEPLGIRWKAGHGAPDPQDSSGPSRPSLPPRGEESRGDTQNNLRGAKPWPSPPAAPLQWHSCLQSGHGGRVSRGDRELRILEEPAWEALGGRFGEGLREPGALRNGGISPMGSDSASAAWVPQ